jgi:tRNA uridine 5-carbamoylmethylation protein Kti12
MRVKEYGGKVVIEYVEVPYSTLISQNHNREYKVPQDIIEKMVNKLEVPYHEEACTVNFNITE